MFKEAACFGIDTATFFPDPKDRAAKVAALAICASCPVQLECLVLALENDEKDGIWGGASPSERHYIHRYKVKPEDYLKIKCGTDQGYYRHRRLNEIACDKCKAAFKVNHNRRILAAGEKAN